MIETRKREHSRKPDEQYELIGKCSPGPYLEMFARHPQNGWIAWGDESSEAVTPRGKVHKGYQGGEILPPLKTHEHVSEPIATAIGREIRLRYENGASIRDIAEETGYSIQRVRSLLNLAEAAMRPRGRPTVSS